MGMPAKLVPITVPSGSALDRMVGNALTGTSKKLSSLVVERLRVKR